MLMLHGKGEHLASDWLQRRQAAWSRPHPVSLMLLQRWQLRLQAPDTAKPPQALDCRRHCCSWRSGKLPPSKALAQGLPGEHATERSTVYA